MAAGSTYTPIATLTSSGGSAYGFTSIPSTYTDLVFVFNGVANAGSQTINMTFNSDTGSNYSWTWIQGDGSSATSTRGSNDNRIVAGQTGSSTSNFENMFIVNLQNYSNTTTYKTVLNRSASASRNTLAIVGLWRNTAAITSISVTPGGNNFASGSTFTLFGIAAA